MDWNEYVKEYQKKHPEKAKQYRINTMIHHLEKLGYKVTPPPEKAKA